MIHGVQHVFHPPVRLPRWPDADQRTRIVLITRDLDPSAVQELFDAFLGAMPPTSPTAPRSLDNPLVPFGGATVDGSTGVCSTVSDSDRFKVRILSLGRGYGSGPGACRGMTTADVIGFNRRSVAAIIAFRSAGGR